MWITNLALRRPLVVLMAVAALLLGGIMGYQALAVALLPQAKFPYVAVTIGYPGAGPREVEARITKPVEDALVGASAIERLTSIAADGYGTVVVQFREGTHPDEAARDIERQLGLVRADLPAEALEPVVWKFDPNSAPILNLAVKGNRPVDELFDLADQVIRPRLQTVPGVGGVQLVGGLEREIQIKVDPTRLQARGLSLQQVTGALAASNLSVPGGLVSTGQREYSVRVYGLEQSVERLGDLVVAATPFGTVRLRDVATVEQGFKRRERIARVDGQDAVGILVQRQSWANTATVTEEVAAVLRGDLRRLLPADVQVVTVIDEGRFVRASLDGLNANLREAVLITGLVLLLFLHTWRATAIVLISIPTSLVATFAVMWLAGFSVNMMTTMALALSIGILVDDSIVVLENIYRHMKLGDEPVAAALNGRAEIGAAAVAITLVDVVVYAPVAFLTGVVGQFFREFGITIVAATLFSLAVSFTLTPMLAARWVRADDEERSPLRPLWRLWDRGYEALGRAYRGLLAFTLKARWLTIGAGALAFAAGIALVMLGFLGTEFVRESDQSQFVLALDMPPGTSLDRTNEVTRIIEERLARIPEVQSFLTSVGSGGQFTRPQHRSARIWVRLKDKRERSRDVFAVAADGRQLGADVPGLEARTNLPNVVGMTSQPLIVRVRGDDMDVLTRLANQVEQIVRRTPGTADVTNSGTTGAPELRVVVDQRRLADLGLTTAQVAAAVRTAFEGTVATQYRPEGRDKVDVRVLFTEDRRATPDSLPDVPLLTNRGTIVLLRQVATLQEVDSPAEIDREGRQRQIQIGANLAGRPLGDVARDVQREIDRLQLPPGYGASLGGDTEQQQSGFRDLGTALVISVVLIYMLMVALYESLTYPLVVLFSLPLASVGAIGALIIAGDTLNIMAMVGLIMLTGLVAKNAILLVDYTNTLRHRGLARDEALLEAGPVRLRPILMTTFSLVFAMIPLALKFQEGSELRSSMAIAVMGGLTSSMLLTLVVVPAAYTILDDIQVWVARVFGRFMVREGRPEPHRPTQERRSYPSASDPALGPQLKPER